MNQHLGGRRATWLGLPRVGLPGEQEVNGRVVSNSGFGAEPRRVCHSFSELPFICSFSSLGLCFLTLYIGTTAPISLGYLKIR